MVFERDENRMENNCRLTSGTPYIDYAFLLMFPLLQSSINLYETSEAIEVYWKRLLEIYAYSSRSEKACNVLVS